MRYALAGTPRAKAGITASFAESLPIRLGAQ